jgi:hypothetical protein
MSLVYSLSMAPSSPKLIPLRDVEPVCEDCRRPLVSGEFVDWEDGDGEGRVRCAICALSASPASAAGVSESSPS